MKTPSPARKFAHRRSALGAVAVVASLSMLSGCGGKSVSEKIAEKAVENKTDVKVDQGKDGSMTMKTKDGTVETGTGKVPSSFPKEIALPKGKVTTTVSSKGDGKQYWMVTIETDDLSKTAAQLKDAWTKSGYKIESDLDQDVDGKRTTMLVAKKGDVAVMGMGEQTTGATGAISVTVEKPA
jgi:hypothetical protein